MGLKILSGHTKTHWRLLANQVTLTEVLRRFVATRRHIYVEPDIGWTWMVCVDAEHAAFLDAMLSPVMTGAAYIHDPVQEEIPA